ncbi:MAG: catechol 1,2-dioxygenase, partial [Williamsia herbipolensis]|nr:catechol 1,2-dioxygenase [Williamsia herbipolensis]
MTVDESVATAAASGANATQRFATDKRVVADTPPERVSMLAREVLSSVHATIRDHQV